MRVAGLLGAVALFGSLASGAWAQTAPQVTTLGPKPPATYLYIGNSFFYYNNGITNHLTGLVRGAGANAPAHRATMATIGGSGFDWHDVESYFRPNAVGSYIFDQNNNIVFNTAAAIYTGILGLYGTELLPTHLPASAMTSA